MPAINTFFILPCHDPPMSYSASTLGLFTPASTDPTTSLLGILYSRGAATASAGNGVNPTVALQTALATETKSVAAVAAQPQVARDIAAFRAAVANAKTPAALLANPAAVKVLLTANGLGDQASYTALVSKALLSDTSQTGSLASKLSNPQFLATAKTYDFANKGLSVLQKPSVLDAIANGYAEVQWRTSLDQNTPGLSNALTFRARASTIKSADDILGDPTLRTVVTTALGIPQQIAFQTLNAQEKAITNQLDITKFQSPAFVDQFTKRYLVAASTAASSTTFNSVTSLFA